MALGLVLFCLSWIWSIPSARAADGAQAPVTAAGAPDGAAVERVMAKLERLTGVARRKPVAARTMDRAAIQALVLRQLEADYTDAEIREETLILQTLGLLPAGTDLKRLVTELYTEQLGGFYDPDSGTYVMADWIDPSLQEAVMAHELVHALQDQYGGLGALQDRVRHDDDAALALMALLEGGATTAMLAYMLDTPVEQVAAVPGIAAMMRAAARQPQGPAAVFARAPAFLQAAMLFPYLQGTDFACRLLATRSFAQYLRLVERPPETTEQILHPEKFLAVPPEGARHVAVGETEWREWGAPVGRPRRWGQFQLAEFLKRGLPEADAERAARGWGGDALRLLDRGPERPAMVLWLIAWDSSADADRFLAALGAWAADAPRLTAVRSAPDTVLLRIGGERP
jgi:hypothetical protein